MEWKTRLLNLELPPGMGENSNTFPRRNLSGGPGNFAANLPVLENLCLYVTNMTAQNVKNPIKYKATILKHKTTTIFSTS